MGLSAFLVRVRESVGIAVGVRTGARESRDRRRSGVTLNTPRAEATLHAVDDLFSRTLSFRPPLGELCPMNATHPPVSAPPPSAAARRAMWGMLALYAVSAIGVGIQRTIASPENNFIIFRTAFDHLIAGQNLYDAYPAIHSDFFKYSPTFAFLFAPFALLPLVPGYILWALVCAGAVWTGIVRLLPWQQALVALAIAWLAVVGDMQRAQSNALCAGLMILAWGWMERGAHWRAAIAVTLGALIKLFPVAVLASAIFYPRKMRFGLVVAIVLVLGVLLPLIAISPDSLGLQYQWWRAIEARDAAPLVRYGAGGADLYAGLMGQFRVWFGVDWPHWPVQLGGLLVLLAPLLVQWNRWDRNFRLQFLTSILVFCVLFNHKAESPSYAIATIGAAIWFAASERATWRTVLIVLVFAVVNLASTDLMPRSLYRTYYVPYLMKTLPLIPLWVAMQLELLGVLRNAGRPSEIAESDERDIAAGEPRAHGG